MPLRSSALSALFLTAGCAAGAANQAAAKPLAVHAAPSTAVTPPAKSEGGDGPGAAAKNGPPPAAELPPPQTAATTTPAEADTPKRDPFGDVGFKEVNEKAWLAGIRDKIAEREKVAPTDVRLSPGLLRAVYVRSSPVAAPAKPGRRPAPRRHEIVVVDNQGARVASFRPIVARGSDEPPGDLRFLSEDRLVYEVMPRAPAATAPTLTKAPAAKAKNRPAAHAKNPHATAKPTHETTHTIPTAAPPPRLFVIQPLAPPTRPIRCQGLNFTFAPQHDRLAFVGGPGGTAFVAVDGMQVYPRRGHTTVVTAPVWSKDGLSLAFLEQPPARPARLVLVAAFDNPKGDTTWDLPADAKIDGASVLWAGTGKLIVRKTAVRPIFTASFVTER